MACLGRQHFQRLNDGLSDVRSANCLLEDLLAWLNRAEVTLCEHNRQIIPDDKGSVEQLLREHQVFYKLYDERLIELFVHAHTHTQCSVLLTSRMYIFALPESHDMIRT